MTKTKLQSCSPFTGFACIWGNMATVTQRYDFRVELVYSTVMSKQLSLKLFSLIAHTLHYHKSGAYVYSLCLHYLCNNHFHYIRVDSNAKRIANRKNNTHPAGLPGMLNRRFYFRVDGYANHDTDNTPVMQGRTSLRQASTQLIETRRSLVDPCY